MINNIDNKNPWLQNEKNENMLFSHLNKEISNTQNEIEELISEDTSTNNSEKNMWTQDINDLKQYLRNNHSKLYTLCNNLEEDLTTNIYVQLHVQSVSKQEIQDIKQEIQDRVEWLSKDYPIFKEHFCKYLHDLKERDFRELVVPTGFYATQETIVNTMRDYAKKYYE
jgi:hypothetical protein